MSLKTLSAGLGITFGFLFCMPASGWQDIERDSLSVEKEQYAIQGRGNPRIIRPFGAHMGYATTLLGDPQFLMLKINYFIIPQIEIEINPGFKYSSAGVKFHLNLSESECILTPYTGALLGMERGTAIIQVPVGIQLISRKGFSTSLDCTELIYLEYNRFELMFEISAGWRFRCKNLSH